MSYAATTASASSDAGAAVTTSPTQVTDQAVLEYLKSKGMAHAVLELTQKLQGNNNNNNDADITPPGATPTKERLEQVKVQMETQDEVTRAQRSVLSRVTGGGFGYDRDAAAPVAQWGVPDTPSGKSRMGVDEAKSYLDAFCALQLWVLSLPDDDGGWQPKTENPISRAKALLAASGVAATRKTGSTPGTPPEKKDAVSSKKDDIDNSEEESELDASDQKKTTALDNVIQELIKPAVPVDHSASFPIPPSAKPELLSVSFALLVHTYCELLEVGMETTAHILRDAFKPVYEPIYGQEYNDLYHCLTTEDMVKLNTHNSQHMEAVNQLKGILIQIAQIQAKHDELSQSKITDPNTQQLRVKKLQEYKQTVGLLQQRHTELSQRASTSFERMVKVPFLRRARAVRWQITLCNTSYGMLCQFFRNTGAGVNDTSLLAMSTLLQTKCELHIERRDPLPFTPAVILDDNATAGMSTTSRDKYKYLNQDKAVLWAAPVAKSMKQQDGDRPFPKFNLDEEYDDERSALRSRSTVEFNRALLVNGFRRLEALERKREYEVMASSEKAASGDDSATEEHQQDGSGTRRVRVANPLEPSILLSTLCANQTRKAEKPAGAKGRSRTSSLGGLTDLARGGSASKSGSTVFSEYVWEESGIGITCAKLCQPDGRKVAIGCDDSAIRVWNLLEDLPKGAGHNQAAAGDAGVILLGHKNGFPVFDLSWNRDGRSLLSAGGDGSVRLWDTAAQGPFGEVVSSSSIKGTTGRVTGSQFAGTTTKKGTLSQVAARDALTKATANLENAQKHPDMSVPGLRPETRKYTSGAALAVYRGHAPNTPIWSVAFAPCGYYFASAGSDATARLWTTDRPIPVRLFAGHTSNCVHSVVFHPNCNYVLTGGEDKTVRLWDIQTGRCVRLLNGCPSGIYKVDIDPSGQYAVGADVLGTVHLWDLATGKKVTELRAAKPSIPAPPASASSQLRQNVNMVHSLAFSACGTALATGGDDRCVRIWDVRKAISDPSPVIGVPHKYFGTRRTMIMDLQFSKRNLLMSVGKYITGIPAINTIPDK
jgi:WD40 repeat protein